MIDFVFKLPLIIKKLIILVIDIILSFSSLIVTLFLLEKLSLHYNIIYLLCISLSFVVFFLFGKSYSEIIRFTSIYNVFKIFRLLTLNLILILIISFLLYGFKIEIIQLSIVYTFIFTFNLLLSRFFIVFINNNLKLLNKKNIIIYGAGEAGVMALNSLKSFKVNAFIDDDNSKIGRTIQGIPVISFNEITKVVSKEKIDNILIAIPSLLHFRRAQIIANLKKFNIEIKILPKIDDFVISNFDFNKFSILASDLIDRKIDFSKEEIFAILKNKVTLITGGGGSLGSSLVKNILQSNPKKIIIIDNNEYNLFKIKEDLIKLNIFYNTKTVLEYKLISINDYSGLENIFIENNPDLIFHAGAYKHVNLLENNIYSAYKNNIVGSFNLIKLSREFNCERFIFISTDKAVNPSSVMGKTKRIIENYITFIQNQNSNQYFSIVRFGNVINSNGSVIPIFEKQIIDRQPITLTHPDVTRFFMSIDEAINLVLETLRYKKNVIYVLNMGKPIKILDIAKKLVSIYGLKIKDRDNPNGDIEIKLIGLRDGEKLHEELFYKNAEIKKLNDFIDYQKNEINLKTFESFEEDIQIFKDTFDGKKIEQIFDKYI